MPAGTAVRIQEPPRYTHINLNGVNYLAHRVAWKYMTGEEPVIVDHIDGNRANNKFKNLRSATPQQNAWNRSQRQAHTASELVGIAQIHGKTLWRAYIRTGDGTISIGPFKSAQAAQAARDYLMPLYRGDFHRSN
jgi:hypothetical protein